MKKAVASLLFWAVLASSQEWKAASPAYRFHFPQDHFEHADFQSEWWYYTGNLQTTDGHRFGYELTFFRQATKPADKQLSSPVWEPQQIYLAHLAVSDVSGHQFFHTERLNRSGPGLAGADQNASRYWNGNWQVRWLHPGQNAECELQAFAAELALTLTLQPKKDLVLQGPNGLSVKGPLPGEASHYYSFTRMQTTGRLIWKGKSYNVEGSSWMDHEFLTEPADNALLGWDWLSIQLNNGEELMLYRLRRAGEKANSFSSGTYVRRDGHVEYLSASQFQLTPTEDWTSPQTRIKYPTTWQISVPKLDLKLTAATPLKAQELVGSTAASPTYWEGAMDYTGTFHGAPVSGVGYLEMTGYGKRIRLGTSS